MLRFSILLLICLLAATLQAQEETKEFNVLLDGVVVGKDRESVEGAVIEAKADECWGFPDQKLMERAEKTEGKFPKATVTGSATSGREGKFKIDVKVTLKGTRIPKHMWGNPPVETCFVHVHFTATKPGYVTRAQTLMVTPVEPINNVHLSQFVKAVTVSGRAVSKSNTPLADVPFYFASENEYLIRAHIRPPLLPPPQTRSDKDGYFKFEGLDPFRSSGRMVIPDVETLAVHPNSPHWSGISLYDVTSEVKLGDVVFWPAGSIKVTFCNEKGEKAIAGAKLELCNPSMGRYLALSNFVEKGVFEFKRLPEGLYALSGYGPDETAITVTDIAVQGGKVTDLGTKTLTPPCDLTLKLEAPAGVKFMNAILQLRKLDGYWPGAQNERDRFLGLPCRNEGTQSGRDTFEFRGLPLGKYEIWVRSHEFAATSQVFQLSQRKETVTVKIPAGVRLKVSITGPDGRPAKGAVFLFHEASPAYRLFQESKGESPKLKLSFLNNNSLDVAENVWVNPEGQNEFRPLIRPGKYVVLAFPERLGRIVKTDFAVTEGNEAELRLEVMPAKVKLTCTQAGKPCVEAMVYLVNREALQFVDVVPAPGSRRMMTNATFQAKTNKKGEAIFDKMPAGEYVALNASEHQYLAAFGYCVRRDEFSETLPKRFFTLEHGESALKYDFPAYKGTWLTISVKWGQESENHGARLIPSTPGLPVIEGFGAPFHFGLVAKGKYECIVHGDSFRSRAALVHKIDVNKSGEQSINVEPAWRELTLKIDEKDFDNKGTVVYMLRAASSVSDPKCVITESRGLNWTRFNVAPGDYVLTTVWKSKPNGDLCTAVEKIRVAGKDLKIDLKPARSHGAIQLQFAFASREGLPMSGESNFRLLNAAGAEVALADAGLRTMNDFNIYGVPPGTYSLEVDFSGYEPLRLQNISVKAGEVTPANCAPRALKSLDCSFESEGLTLALLQSARVVAYDDNNGTLQPTSKVSAGWAEYLQSTLVLQVTFIPAAAKKVSIKIAGFKELLLDLEATPLTTRQAKLERE